MAKVTFNGTTKRISVNPGETSLSVKLDLYSAWKDWVAAGNAQYEQAMRSIGGDPIGPGLYAGDIYFLMNGWKVEVDHSVDVSGILYCEDGSAPFVAASGTSIVRATVSNLAQTVATGGTDLTPVLDKIDGVADLVVGLS
jgi:hypothetical protein